LGETEAGSKAGRPFTSRFLFSALSAFSAVRKFDLFAQLRAIRGQAFAFQISVISGKNCLQIFCFKSEWLM
jgi:hypothetical protein